ncbi:uncharacterized protein LOC127717497 [Mytilus californianus]|uniref:uncharacterized protein LOC127717497 n=1 Tax=Mytilus californianus TaxID=6549 RepID=UPI002245D994|nr:uncharacterized protein LOC127717497 [Mytilus californianus]
MVRTSKEKCESLNFYKYLCPIIGSEEVVRIRRLKINIVEICLNNKLKVIISGSKGEGLDLKGSDIDLMSITSLYKVYQSETEVVFDGLKIPLIMNTEETLPCFAQLRLLDEQKDFKFMWENSNLGGMLSSEIFRRDHLSLFPIELKIHGPCLSDMNDFFDVAFCLKCDQWIFQAKPWVSRPRTTWPLPGIISKIISCGVLFVPIGCKGSIKEHLEWRISFSLAERLLIYSFSHTQLLCYALLKIVLKEIVEKHIELKGLLCSYFLKTLMFWISEETDQNLWRPDNIIPCFMACLQRLLYCVRYSILSHYFIPDNNFFDLRFSGINKEKLATMLKKLYEQGINCFASSETLQDYQGQSYKLTESLSSGHARLLPDTHLDITYIKIIHLLYNFLRHSRTGLSRGLFALYISKACWSAPDTSKYQYSSENKQQYSKYKYDLIHLSIGLHSDAISGWLTLASFLYVHKKYFASSSVIKFALKKYHERSKTGRTLSEYAFIQRQKTNLMKKQKLNTALKAITIQNLTFRKNSSIIPQELQLDVSKSHAIYDPLSFAYFLSFLCYYHLQDMTSCRYYLQQLRSTINFTTVGIETHLSSPIFCGIAYQLMGDTYVARQFFQQTAKLDLYNLTSAASRLSSVI